MLYTYDIFDTIITRIWFRPHDLFLELAKILNKKGLMHDSSKEWEMQRRLAEARALDYSTNEDVGIKDIYHELSKIYDWSKIQEDEALLCEIECEKKSIRGVAKTIEEIKKIHENGHSIAYLTDMYLPANFIKDILVKNGVWGQNDSLFVSSEIGKRKSSGNLYKYYLAQTKALPQDILHTGDNAYSDGRAAEALGINVRLCNYAPNRYEVAIYNTKTNTINKSLVAGITRTIRLSRHFDDIKNQTIWESSVNITSILLYGYVSWVLLEAKKRNVRRLYFLARDGQILIRIATIINNNWALGLELKYLYASRQAWHIASITETDKNIYDLLFSDTKYISVRSALSRVNQIPEDYEIHLTEYGLAKELWNRDLDAIQLCRLREFIESKKFKQNLIIESQRCRKILINYFHQEKIYEEGNIALVDIGWSGRLQKSFNTILDIEAPKDNGNIIGFYFGLLRRMKAKDEDVMLAYMYDGDNTTKIGYYYQKDYIPVIEMFAMANHGSTTQYKMSTDGKYIPVFREINNSKAIEWGIKHQHDAIAECAEELSRNMTYSEEILKDFQLMSNEVLKLFLEKPSSKEAAVYGEYKYAEGQTESKIKEIAPILNNRTCNILFRKRHSLPTLWLEGSIQRTYHNTSILLWLISFRNLLKALLKR